ncbi:UDP-glucosyltransferase 2-like [Daktulosphaira vitifoliae]|uniref:UDP-glucosyltransferase 2-like n=1 Tax=Daktulosphaira vitifoliae TaxID=58002 RepID=UPI0021AA8C34|nr:UDP-glucosyltransferase 2-like [Daktulosphaira vitifoliae]
MISQLECARILAIEMRGGISHWNFMRAVLLPLTERGHQVTVFTPFLDGHRENYTEIDLSKIIPLKVGLMVKDSLVYNGPFHLMLHIPEMTRAHCNLLFDDTRIQNILKNHGRFDIVLLEPMASECGSYFALKLKIPLVYVIPTPMITYMEMEFTGHLSNPTVISNIMAKTATPKSFNERLSNAVLLFFSIFTMKFLNSKLSHANPKSFDVENPIKPTILFVNTHTITEPSRPYSPNVVQLGGIHLKPAGKIPEVRTDLIK